MVKTGVFATEEETAELMELARIASSTPVIAFGSEHAMRGGASGDAWHRVSHRCHTIALSHGLPEIQGFYGCGEDGEFLECGCNIESANGVANTRSAE